MILVLRMDQRYGDEVAAVQWKEDMQMYFPEVSTLSASIVTWRARNV